MVNLILPMQAISSSNTDSKLIMAFSRWQLTFVLLYYIQNKGVIAQYRQWNCSEPDEHGESYIPGVRDYPSDVLTTNTSGDAINIYRVQPLNAECFGEVTAIEYCYRYNTAVPREAVFNWTVLIIEETTVFTVTKIYILESRPSSFSEGECVNIDGGGAKCCDRKLIEGFQLPRNFVFGVTESAQGNTAGVTLLGFFDDDEFSVQPEYVVDTLQTIRGQTALSVGSTLPKPAGGVQRGLRMVWFVIAGNGAGTITSTVTTVTDSQSSMQTTSVISQYQWNCSMPDDHGERYIPGVRNYPSNVPIITDGRLINLYRVQNLNPAECTGEVTAIEFCYRYSTRGQGELTFNWTVLILEETNVFTITRIFIIESRPNSSSETDCVNINNATVFDCCDREYISNFNFEPNDFIFGVIPQTAQGNTHKATLLGTSELLPEYEVDTLLISTAEQTIGVGSILPKPDGVMRGLPVLWFVIENITNVDEITTDSTPTNEPATNEIMTPSEASTTTSTAITILSRGSDSLQADPGIVIGAVVPVSFLLLAVVVLTLALLHLARKYMRVMRNKETKIAMAQNVNTLDMEMNTNNAYVQSIVRLDSMESNAAYHGTAVDQDSNSLYETISNNEILSEGITQAQGSGEQIQNEKDLTDTIYDYIDKDDKYV